MYINRIELKEQAKQCLRGARPAPVLVTLLYVLIPFAIVLAVNLASDGAYLSVEKIADPRIENMINFVAMLLWLTEMVLLVGYLAYCLDVSEGRESSYSVLFTGFSDALRVVWLTILMTVFVFLWSLLLIIPGIVAFYSYRMAYFLIIENPDMTAMEAIRTSKRMMQGYKMDLFVLELSFIGWSLLGALTFGILYLWLIPYMYTSRALFYRRLLSGNSESDSWTEGSRR